MSSGNAGAGNLLSASNARAQTLEEQHQGQSVATDTTGGAGGAIDVMTNTHRGLAQDVQDPAAVEQHLAAYEAGMESAVGQGTSFGKAFVGEAQASVQKAKSLVESTDLSEAEGPLGKAAAALGLLVEVEQALSGPFSLIPFPALPAVRVGDVAFGLPHAHNHPPNLPPPPPIPLPSFGPVIPLPWGISGAERTLINGQPAARCGDMGIGIWCGGWFPLYEILLGSSSVWIEGARAARVGVDLTLHCLLSGVPKPKDIPTLGVPLGFTITASQNVIIGGVPLPSLLSLLLAGALKLLGIGLRKLVNVARKAGREAAESAARRSAKRSHQNQGCGECGEPIDIVTGANVDDFIDFTLPAPRFVWRRWYNSQHQHAQHPGPLGWGFRHEYQRELRYDATSAQCTYIDQEGKAVLFPSFLTDLPGERVVQHGYILTRLSGQRYALTTHHQPALELAFRDMTEPALPVALRDADRHFAFEYDAQARLVRMQLDAERTVHFAYASAGLLSEVVLEQPGQEPIYVARYQYDDNGCLGVFQDALDRVARYDYDGARQMTRKTDRRGYSYHYRYDAQGRCVYTHGDDGLYEGWLEYYPEGNTTLVKYADGGTWTYEYNKLGTITKIIDPYGGILDRSVDPETGMVTHEIDPAGNATELLYDAHGAHTGRRDPFGYWAPPLAVDPHPPDPLAHTVPATPLAWECGTLLDRDFIGAVSPDDPLLESFPEVAAETGKSRPSASRRNQPAVPQEKYDLLGRLSERRNADGSAERWEYDAEGNEVVYMDGDGSVYRKEYVSWNLLHRQTDPDGDTCAFQYSPTEKITQFVDAGGTVHDFVYDQKDRLVEVRRNGFTHDMYRYDETDNLIEKLDGNGRRLLVCEPGFGRLDRMRRFADGEVYQYAYNERGRITTAQTRRDTVVFDYDEEGKSTRDERNGLGVKNDFASGEVISTTVFRKFMTRYRRGYDGTLVITDPTGRTHTFYFSKDGLILKELANGTRELVQYDAQGRCLRKVVSAADGERHRKSHRYSAAGDLVRVEDIWRGTVQYHYDAAHRLKVAEYQDGRTDLYAHDAAGNLVLQPGLEGIRIGAGNQLQQANGEWFYYDHRSNVVRRESEKNTTRYEYDAFDQLVGISWHGREWQADYDALGRRTRKCWLGQTTEYYWDHDRLSAEIRSDRSVRIYVYADDRTLVPFLYVDYASIDAEPASGVVKYLFTNHLGVPERVEDDFGKTIWQGEVSPYGTIYVAAGRQDEINLRFPGHYYDVETGLHYNRFRYYDPVLGCYLQCDPLGIAGGYNLYTYLTNPLTGVDILGLAHQRPGRHQRRPQGNGDGKRPTQTSSEVPPMHPATRFMRRVEEPSISDIRKLRRSAREKPKNWMSEELGARLSENQSTTARAVRGEKDCCDLLGVPKDEKMVDHVKIEKSNFFVPVEVKNQKTLDLGHASEKFKAIANHADQKTLDRISHFEVIGHTESTLPGGYRVTDQGVLEYGGNRVQYGGKEVRVYRGEIGRISAD